MICRATAAVAIKEASIVKLLYTTQVLFAAALLTHAAAATAQSQHSATMEGQDALSAWQTTGSVSIDDAQKHGGSGAMKVEPGATATWKLRDTDGAGKVEIWVYEDQTKPEKPKERRAGPTVGIVDASGRIIAVGSIYAPYLSGDGTYSAGEWTPAKKEQPYFHVNYLGIKRTAGWHKWTFDFDADKGLTILHNDKDVNAQRKRYDWNKSDVKGFAGVIVIGDEKKEGGQTIWVDDVNVALGGEMNAQPTPPPPPPPVVPEKDPALEGPVPTLNKEVMAKHPRLLFGPEDIEKMKAKLDTPMGKLFNEQFKAYLPPSTPPDNAKFQTDATDGQRQGLWRMPTVALHYTLTGDQNSFKHARGFLEMLLDLEAWETTSERDSGMSSANIMIGAALTYDMLYNDLDPDFREKFRKKLILHARKQYHGGHLRKNPGTHYWQGDPQNNHRWHRNAGMTLAILAAYEGNPEEQWILAKTREDLDYVNEWLPEDGTSHEGLTYMIFGGTHLLLAVDAADRCFDPQVHKPYLPRPFYKSVGEYLMAGQTPDMEHFFNYGDSGGGGLHSAYANFLYATAAAHEQKDVQAALDAAWKRAPNRMNVTAWSAIIWYEPSLSGASLDDLPTRHYFEDLGLLFVRDGWTEQSTGAMFKAGPMGGFRLNEFRNDNGFQYINVAHDDPDANAFVLWKDGRFIAETDRYSKHKQSSNYNTILINGMGQMAKGRPEGGVWSQPATGKTDMTKMAYITAYEPGDDLVIIEGEAAGSYLSARDRKTGATRPDLDRFRRTFVWVEGQYLLVIDDIKAPSKVDVTWLMQAPKMEVSDADAHRYTMSNEGQAIGLHVVPSAKMTGQVVESTADHRGSKLGWRQLQLKANTDAVRVYSVYDAFGKGPLTLKVDEADDGKSATLTVTGQGVDDTWQWTSATNDKAPAKVALQN